MAVLKEEGTMIAEKKITICGKEVLMRYCAATETGFEALSGKPADVFIPDVIKDDEGNVVSVEQHATTEDFLKLAVAAIIAAYARIGEESPVSTDDILYEAQPADVTLMMTTVIELRNEWYRVPETVKPEMEEQEEDKKKNALPPASSSNKS